MNVNVWTFYRHDLRDWTHILFNNPFKNDTFYILLFGYQNGLEVINKFMLIEEYT